MKLKQINEEMLKHLHTDKDFLTRIKNFKNSIVTKNLEFLMNNTIGEQPVVFDLTQEETFYNEIIKVNPKEYRKALLQNPKILPTYNTLINGKYNSLIYIIHCLITGKIKSKNVNVDIENVYFIFFFIRMSSKLTHDFGGKNSYRPTKEIAHSTFEAMSKKSIIKKTGSWMGVMKHASQYYMEGGAYFNRLKTFNDDEIIEIIILSVKRLTDYVKNQFSVMVELKNGGELITTSSKLNEFDGVQNIKIEDSNISKKINYMKRIVHVDADFIKPRLVEYVAGLANIETKMLTNILLFISKNFLGLSNKEDLLIVPIRFGYSYVKDKKKEDSTFADVMILFLYKLQSSKAISMVQQESKENTEEFILKNFSDLNMRITKRLAVAQQLYLFGRSISGDKI